MDVQKIKELALANGFSLKPQASGNMDLHSYVYEFAQAVAAEAVAQAIPEGFVLVPKEIPDHVVQRLENSSYHWGDSTRDYFAPIYEMMIEAVEGE